MKREHLEEAERIIRRLSQMEEVVQYYEKYKKENEEDKRFSWGRLFVKAFSNARKRSIEFDIGCAYEKSIPVSEKQQEELAELLKKWIEEDKQELDKL